MNKAAWMAALVLVGLLAWFWLAAPELTPGEDPWIRLLEQAERASLLDEKLEASKRFGAVLEETERAMAHDRLPLRQAAELLVHYILSHYEHFVDCAGVRSFGEPGPEREETLVEKMAFMLVRRTRLEFQAYGNRAGYPPEFLQRLECEFRALQGASVEGLKQ